MRWVGEAEGGWTKDKPKTGAGEALLPSAGVDAALLGLLLLGVSRRPSGSAIAAASDRRTAQAGLAGVCVYGLLPLAALLEGFQPCVVMADLICGRRFGRAESFCQAGPTCKQPSVAEYWRDVIGESECCRAKRKSVKRAWDGMGWRFVWTITLRLKRGYTAAPHLSLAEVHAQLALTSRPTAVCFQP